MACIEQIRRAIDSLKPAEALRAVVVELRDQGRTADEIAVNLNDLLADVRANQPESPVIEVILDALDAVVGWCHPAARLFPNQLRTE